MEPRDYAGAVGRRWVWVAGAGVAGAVVAVALALATAVSFSATTSLYVGVARAESAERLANSSLVEEEVLPSVLQLATSAEVLGPVADDLDLTPADLATRLEVGQVPDTSLLQISASAPTAEQAVLVADGVAEQLQIAATDLFTGTEDASSLRLAVVGPAQEPRFQTSPATRRSALVGLAGGLALGVLGVGLARLVRPRVHDADDVADVLGAPALATIHAGRPGRRSAGARTADLDRLRWLLRSSRAAQAGGRIVLLGTTRRGAGALAGEIGPDGFDVVDVTTPDLLAGSGVRPGDVVVVVAERRRTSRRSLCAALAAVEELPAPLLGVVVDGVPPSRAGAVARIAAALRGEAALGARLRTAASGDGATGSARIVAVLALFALGLAYPLPAAMTTGLIATVALLPVWVGALPRFRGGALLAVLAAVGLVCGLLLARRAVPDHAASTYLMAETTFHVISAVGIIGVVLWSRTILPLSWIGVAYGAGRLVTGILRAPGSDNAVKFELALPIALVLLALVTGRRWLLAALAALAALGLLTITNDARSAFGFCAVAAGLVLWQVRPPTLSRRSNRIAGAVLLAAVAAGAYFAISELLLAGALGTEVQARTATQIAQSGSLLIGGRPEWTATLALMQSDFWGFGLGTVPSPSDVMVAKAGMAVTHIPTAESYLEHYMMSDRVELHSIIADLWANLGPVGLVLGIAMLVLLVQGLLDQVARREASALVCFLVPTSAWFLAFGPLPSNLPEVAFTVGLVLAARTTVPVSPATPSEELPAREPVALA